MTCGCRDDDRRSQLGFDRVATRLFEPQLGVPVIPGAQQPCNCAGIANQTPAVSPLNGRLPRACSRDDLRPVSRVGRSERLGFHLHGLGAVDLGFGGAPTIRVLYANGSAGIGIRPGTFAEQTNPNPTTGDLGFTMSMHFSGMRGPWIRQAISAHIRYKFPPSSKNICPTSECGKWVEEVFKIGPDGTNPMGGLQILETTGKRFNAGRGLGGPWSKDFRGLDWHHAFVPPLSSLRKRDESGNVVGACPACEVMITVRGDVYDEVSMKPGEKPYPSGTSYVQVREVIADGGCGCPPSSDVEGKDRFTRGKLALSYLYEWSAGMCEKCVPPPPPPTPPSPVLPPATPPPPPRLPTPTTPGEPSEPRKPPEPPSPPAAETPSESAANQGASGSGTRRSYSVAQPGGSSSRWPHGRSRGN